MSIVWKPDSLINEKKITSQTGTAQVEPELQVEIKGKGLKAIDLFAGIGGLRLGLERAIPETLVVEAVEIDSVARHVYRHHFPETPLYGDIREYKANKNWNYETGIVFGGFPCQDTSCAGGKRGLDGERSGLWWEFLRVVEATRPAFVVIENPEGLRHRGLLDVLRSLAESGYDAEWQTISARCATGAPHWRERIFVVAYSHYISTRVRGRASSWAECLREKAQANTVSQPLPAELFRADSRFRRKNEQRRAEGFNAIPTWLGGKASADWCRKWQPPEYPGRPKKARLGQDQGEFALQRWVSNKCISLYGQACIPEQAEFAFERVRYLYNLVRTEHKDANCIL